MNYLTKATSQKIKTVDELCQIIGERPRGKSVIMCHGVFDVVHPGHLRHLIFAKGKADILIASLTADAHIAKGHYRPHVPQDLRAANLAAYEVVDYVLLDHNAKPLDNIARLQPDYFAKGYEYVDGDMPVETSAEAEVVESYGGEILFTPGDVVYSSSSLIEQSPPNIRTEKLLTLLETEGMYFDDLYNTLDNLSGHHVHVVGDSIVDSYTHTTLIGGQVKTPTLSVRFDNRTDDVGGAGIVARHLRAAGSEVTFSTVLGDDPLGEYVRSELTSDGIDCRIVIDPARPTINKNAIVADGYRLLKVDTLDNSPISDAILGQLTAALGDIPTDCVVFSDFRHGIFNRRTIPLLTAASPDGAYCVADSQVASRWGNIMEFKGFNLITPNEREARFALADQDCGIRPLASALYDAAECGTLILKLGDRGVLTSRGGDHEPPDSFFIVDSFTDNIQDAVGAGDALLAYATLAMLSTRSEVIATVLGSVAAACECEVDGNKPIDTAVVRAKLERIEKEAHYA